MINSRNLVWLIPLCILLSFPLWRTPVATFLTPRGGYDSSFAERKLDSHKFTMENVHITQSKEGKTTLEIVAERAYTGKNDDEFEMEVVDAVVTGKTGEQTYITARKGILDKQEAILTLIEEVVVMKPKDKFELYTDFLIYNDRSKIAHSPGKTLVIGEKIEIRGNNLVFNSLTQAYDLGGRVRCKLENFSSPNPSPL